uniref:SET domain-containing protein n=1 Tax=Alexandrium catenella TaxID=2925 RepID=A0A7S1L1I3_ALECA
MERRREEDRGKTPGVFASGRVSKKNPQSAKPVFKRGDIIGPMGGMLRRRVRFEEVHYNGRTWALHDPQAYEIGLRAKTTELSIEPLVLDLTAGSSRNRLRHLADTRNDPLGLRDILGAPSRPGTAEVGRPRTAMKRVRSRPHSPEGGAGEAEVLRLDDEAPPSPTALSRTLSNGAAMNATLSCMSGDMSSVSGARKAATGTGVPPGENENEASEEMANVKIVEVYVNGWPYAFVVALRDVMPGEELLVDRGREHWVISRFVIERLRDVNQLGRDLLVGTKTERDAKIVEEEAPLSFAPREPMTRVALMKAPARRDSVKSYQSERF